MVSWRNRPPIADCRPPTVVISLPSADIDADGCYVIWKTWHKGACWCIQTIYLQSTWMPMGIVVISGICPSVQPCMGLSLGIVDKSLGRNGLHFIMRMYPDDYHQRIDAYGYCSPSVRLSGRLVSHLCWTSGWLVPSLGDTGDICCHYWQNILVPVRNSMMNQ